jgi:hypothetical protein
MPRAKPPTTGTVTAMPLRNAKLSAEEKLRMFEHVIEHNAPWFQKAVREVGRLPPGWTGTGEDLRYHILTKLDDPGQPNVWGPVTNEGIRLGWLKKTRKRGRMTQVSSHARSTDTYKRTDKPC